MFSQCAVTVAFSPNKAELQRFGEGWHGRLAQAPSDGANMFECEALRFLLIFVFDQ